MMMMTAGCCISCAIITIPTCSSNLLLNPKNNNNNNTRPRSCVSAAANFTTTFSIPPSSRKVANLSSNSTTQLLWNCDSSPFFTLTTPPRRRRWVFGARAAFLDLPLLPFPLDQVLIPSETKTLHLYEARYLKLLDESLFRKKKMFVHFVLDPNVISYLSAKASYAARYGCLVVIEKVEQLDVGALVSIRGIGRVTLVKFAKADPFLEGIVIPLQDNVPENESEIRTKAFELKEALQTLNMLEIKLKTAKEELMQTQTANSLAWAEKEPSLDCDEAFIPSFAERMSFAALQHVSASTKSELLELLKEKLEAMDVNDTMERLEKSLKFVKSNVSMVAAKLAIQSLEMH